MSQEQLKEDTSEWRRLRALSDEDLRREIALNRRMVKKEGWRFEAFMSSLPERERLVLEARATEQVASLFIGTKMSYRVFTMTAGSDLTEEQVAEVVHRVAQEEGNVCPYP